MAAVFRFRFQRILDLKCKQEQALEIELSRVNQSLARAEDARREWECRREEAFLGLRKARLAGNLVENAQWTAYVRHVRGRIAQCRRQVAELREGREHVRRELERVMQSRKLLENYRDRLRERFLAAQEKAEERLHETYSAHKFVRTEGIS